MSDFATMQITGDKEVLRKLGNLAKAVQKRIIKKAVRAGINSLLTAAKRGAPVRFGLLRRQLAIAVKKKGVKHGEWGMYLKAKSAKFMVRTSTGRSIGVNPNKYLHLVVGGTSRGARANDFLARAYAAGRAASIAKLREVSAAEIRKEWKAG